MCQLLPIQRPWRGALALQILPFAFLAWMIRSRMMNKASYREREIMERMRLKRERDMEGKMGAELCSSWGLSNL